MDGWMDEEVVDWWTPSLARYLLHLASKLASKLADATILCYHILQTMNLLLLLLLACLFVLFLFLNY